MAAEKAFASLSSGLLARKGAARPAMRPQGFGQAGAGLEDLGWNDMGFEPPKPAVVPVRDEEHDAFGDELGPQPVRNPLSALTPVQSPVHDQQAEIAGRFAVPEDASEEGEDFDETAELYDPETDPEPAPMGLAPVEQEALEQEPVEQVQPVEEEPVALVVAPAPVQRRRSAPKARTAAGAKGKAAFTLRLDPDRHLKLRLACAVGGRSAQQLVTEALDSFLASIPELDAMAARAKRKE